jgi:hypothetical protein
MAGETDGNIQDSRFHPAALNERILSSISQKHVAPHPWHDLEIGTECSYYIIMDIITLVCYIILQCCNHFVSLWFIEHKKHEIVLLYK